MNKDISLEDIITFTKITTLESGEFNSQTRLCDDLSLAGDDWTEFIIEYSEKFNVNVDNINGKFHPTDEGLSSLSLAIHIWLKDEFLHIPVTLGMLTDFAKLGHWNLDYSNHEAPKLYPKWVYSISDSLIFISSIAIFVFFTN